MGPKKKKIEPPIRPATNKRKTRSRKSSQPPLTSAQSVLLPDVEIKKEIDDMTEDVKFSLDPCDYETLKPWACSVCRKCFKTKGDLTKHERTHTGEKPYTCPICDKSFAIAGNLSKHRAVHSNERPYKCKICDKTYKQQKHLKSHLNIHSGVKNYHCDICGKDFVHSWSWHCHMSNHSGVFKFKCNVCDKGFNISTDYKRHMFVHGGERPLKCSFCDSRFAHSTLLKRHIAIHHTARALKCNRCDKVFDLLSDFKAHKLTHKGEKHLICEYCNKGFGKLSHLKRHYKVHKNKPALCSVCKKSFRTQQELLSHTETHIDIQDDPDEQDITDISEDNTNDKKGRQSFDITDYEKEEFDSKANESEELEFSDNDALELDLDSNEDEDNFSDEKEELDEYEVCTVCKKVLTNEKEFLAHMQAHIKEIDELDKEDDESKNQTKEDSEKNVNNDDEDEDDDIICTKITNEVTGTTVVFHNGNKNTESNGNLAKEKSKGSEENGKSKRNANISSGRTTNENKSVKMTSYDNRIMNEKVESLQQYNENDGSTDKNKVAEDNKKTIEQTNANQPKEPNEIADGSNESTDLVFNEEDTSEFSNPVKENDKEKDVMEKIREESMRLNDQIELDLSDIANEYLDDCSDEMMNDTQDDNDDLPWVEYAMRADDDSC